MSEHQDHTHDDRSDFVPDTVKKHVFDGIEEYDNRLPNWWMWIMYGSIVFSLLYWIVFHTLEIRDLPLRTSPPRCKRPRKPSWRVWPPRA